MNGERVSVIIPTYNRADMLPRAVRSVLAAISPGDEVIVIDDGSTDDTEQALAEFKDRIRYIRTPNGGAGRARNRGVRESKNSLIAFLDSDDEWMLDRLQLGRRLLAARPDVLFCFSEFGLRQEGAPDEHRGFARWHGDPRPWDEILGRGVPYSTIAELPAGRDDFRVHVGSLYTPLLDGIYVNVQTLLVRRERAGAALTFAEDLPTYEDWECSARLARVGPAAYLDCETAWQWGHGQPRLTDANELQRTSARLTVIGRVWATDHTFRSSQERHVNDVIADLHLTRAKCFLREGRCAEARAALDQVKNAPQSYQLLARLPGFMTRQLVAGWTGARRAVRARGAMTG